MITITATKDKDMEKIFWCRKMFGEDFKFLEPMQFTFKNKKQLFLYQIAWGL